MRGVLDVEDGEAFGAVGDVEIRAGGVEAASIGHAATANRAEIREHALSSRLHCRHAAVLGLGDGHELLGAAAARVAHVEVIAHEVQERLVPDKPPGGLNRIAVAARARLRDQFKS